MDLAKLLVKNKFVMEDRIELTTKNRMSYFMSVGEQEIPQAITSFKKWEEAFRVYAGIYTAGNPHRAGELYQCAETISTAASAYVWDNVYRYDQLFRRLMECYPNRNWGIMYHHGWLMSLRDPLPSRSFTNSNPNGNILTIVTQLNPNTRNEQNLVCVTTKAPASLVKSVNLSTNVPFVISKATQLTHVRIEIRIKIKKKESKRTGDKSLRVEKTCIV